MPTYTSEPIPDSCPWGGWTPPNVDWCEEQLCSWIVNPADTWSNLAYVVFGVMMLRHARAHPAPGLSIFGPASIIVGVFSLTYHASYTYFFQFFDFVGMFLFCFTVITANALRLGWIGEERRWHLLIAGTAAFSALVPVVSETSIPIQGMVVLLIFCVFAQEATIRRRSADNRESEGRNFFTIAIVLLGAGAIASAADVTRAWCNPQNHWLQGHSLWHLLTAASLYALYHYYARSSADNLDPLRGRG